MWDISAGDIVISVRRRFNIDQAFGDPDAGPSIFFRRLPIVEAETVLRWRRNGWAALGDIGHLVADEVAAQGLPVRFGD
jgi:hypothetical protein